jgi:hypothetical protein
MSLRILALLAVAALAVAGCAAKPPAGTLKALDYTLPVTGSVVTVYQPFTGQNPTSQAPMGAGDSTQCAQNQVPDQGASGAVQPKCKGPYTTFDAHVTLPPPSAGGFKLYAVGPGFEQELATLKANADPALFVGSANVTEDLSAKVKQVEVRMDGVPVAVAPGTAGNQSFIPAVTGLTVAGTYTGHHLEVTVNGLPANGTFMAKLYVADAASPTGYTAKEEFEVKDGTTSYDSKDHDIADFAQFHIHVGASMVNLYKAAVVPAAK